ncbi:hypothetical protein M405DRAFT_852286 [Rhizopogon salebrosus TDB-379]|nr:hypothetical protein M405DRAFT_852286 [Rhizopogon salebrosus TDB-379]
MSHSGSKLDVEDEEKRQQRIGNLLEQINISSSPKSTSSSAAPPIFDFGERKTFAVDPPSELLARIQDFLPRLKAENDSLAQRIRDDPSSVDIENIEEDTEQYIEMNLGLGVLETRRKRSHSNSNSDDESESASGESSSSSSSTDSTSSAESDSEDVSDSDSSSGSSMRIAAIATRPIKPLPRRAA